MNETIERFFKAMQRGPDGHEELLALFADDAVYVEPFSPGGGVHEGKAAIRAWLPQSQENAPPDMRLTVDRIDAAEGVVEAAWTCESSAWARPSRGRDRFTIENGRIVRLETRLLEPPTPQ
jgi:ketosteroid isomerase-like protein